MGGGATEIVAVGRIGRDVNAAAGVDQPARAVDGQTKTEGVGMAVAAAACALRAGIDHHCLRKWSGVGEHVDATIGKRG